MKDAGGSHFNLKAVHNASIDFKRAHPDARVLGAKEAWVDQLKDCFDALQVLGEDVLAAKLEISRAVDGEKS